MTFTKELSSKLNLWYLDDGFLAGDPTTVLSDLSHVIAASKELGLSVNAQKCEILTICCSDDVAEGVHNEFRAQVPGISIMSRQNAQLLGTALFCDGVTFTLQEKLHKLNCMIESLKCLDRHDAFFLLKNCIAIPSLLYVLRTCPCSSHPVLKEYDDTLRQGLEFIVNTPIDHTAWMQSTLPVAYGGLGIRRATDLSDPAFLSSLFSVYEQVKRLMPLAAVDHHVPQGLPNLQPRVKASQKAWDSLQCERRKNELLTGAPEGSTQRRRLLAATAPKSGIWLNALPSSNLGLKLDNEQLRIAVALRIGAPISQPHQCRQCQAPVDELATHGLSCRYSAGRHPRHRSVNDLLKQAFGSAGIPAVIEPQGLSRSDGKRPDGMTLVPWLRGRALVWDYTCVDTMAESHKTETSTVAGGAAQKAFDKKQQKYSDISNDHCFIPVAMETFGAWAEDSLAFVRQLGGRIAKATGEPRSFSFLLQRLSIAVQKANAASIFATLPATQELDSLYDILF